MHTIELWHGDMTDGIADQWIKENPSSTSEVILFSLVNTASIIRDNYKDVPVFVLKGTGPSNCHELIIFFECGTSNEKYHEVVSCI